MSLILERQAALRLTQGTVATMAGMPRGALALQANVREPDTRLLVDQVSQGWKAIAISGTLTVPLPAGYTSASRLLCYFRASGLCQIAVVSPGHATATHVIHASTVRDGLLCFSDTVTSLTVTNSTTAIKFSWLLILQPDITDADNFKEMI